MKEELHLIPIRYRCQHCGKIYEQGLVHADFWPVQQGFLCPECRETLPHITWVSHKGGTEIRVTTYDSPTRFKHVSGDCGVCNQFPCKHVEFDENGNLSFSKE